MAMTPRSRDAEHFQRIYDGDPDPWRFRTSPYEQSKYHHTLASLHGRRFRSALEVGCSIGVLTRMLAPHCEAVLAIDMIDQALQTAMAACADQPWVRFQRRTVPAEWPEGAFDLIVLSEVLYFLNPTDIAATADRVLDGLSPGGVVLLVNWRGQSDDPCTGEEAAELFLARTQPALRSTLLAREEGYRLDRLEG